MIAYHALSERFGLAEQDARRAELEARKRRLLEMRKAWKAREDCKTVLLFEQQQRDTHDVRLVPFSTFSLTLSDNKHES
jgi:hypothetical protein